MKDGACFLNLSRGLVVDHEALAACLKSGKVAGAAIDVFASEPESGAGFVSALRGLPNVILTPYIGGVDGRSPGEHWAVGVAAAGGLCSHWQFDAERKSAAWSPGVCAGVAPADAYSSQPAGDLAGD
jgi:hypothetical protein